MHIIFTVLNKYNILHDTNNYKTCLNNIQFTNYEYICTGIA